MSVPPSPPLLLTLNELCELLRMSPRQVRNLAKTGRMPAALKIDGRLRWSRKSIEQWIDAGCPAGLPVEGEAGADSRTDADSDSGITSVAEDSSGKLPAGTGGKIGLTDGGRRAIRGRRDAAD